MISKPAVPINLAQLEEVRIESETLGSPMFSNFGNMVTVWNPTVRKWEFRNGMTMNCNVIPGNIVQNIIVTEG